MRRSLVTATVIAAAVAVTAAGCGSSSSGASGTGGSTGAAASSNAPVESIKIVLGQANTGNAVLMYGIQSGLFKKYNLDVSYIVSDPTTTSAVLASGNADLAFSGTATAFLPVLQGKQTTSIYATSGGGAAAYVAGTAGVKSILDCKKMVEPASSIYSGWATQLKKLYNATYEIETVNAVALLVPTITGGRADCTTLYYGGLAPAVGQGLLHLIVDPTNRASLPPGFPNSAIEGLLWGNADQVAKKHDAMARFVAAMTQAAKDVKAMTPEQIVEAIKGDPNMSKLPVSTLVDSVKTDRVFYSPNDGVITRDNWNKLLEFLAASNISPQITPSNPVFAYDKMVDSTLLPKQ